MRDITQHGTCALISLTALAVILPAASGPAFARDIVYVDADVVGGNGGGGSWDNAYPLLPRPLYPRTIEHGPRSEP